MRGAVAEAGRQERSSARPGAPSESMSPTSTSETSSTLSEREDSVDDESSHSSSSSSWYSVADSSTPLSLLAHDCMCFSVFATIMIKYICTRTIDRATYMPMPGQP